MVVGVEVTSHPSAAVVVDQHRQGSVAVRPIGAVADISCLPRQCSVHRHDVFARAEGFGDREIVPTDELRRLLADRRRRIVLAAVGSSWQDRLEAGDVRSAFVGPWHYIINGDGREELYNLDDDPAEERNLAAGPANGNRLREMRSAFEAVWRDAGKQPRLRR